MARFASAAATMWPAMRRLAGMCALLALVVGVDTAGAEGLGVITQYAGADGCFNAAPADGCGEAKTLSGAAGVIVSPDGRHVYVSSFSGGAGEASLLAFRRTNGSGKLERIQCVTADGTGEGGETCAAAPLLGAGQGRDLALSFDGRHLYAASEGGGALLVFTRDANGGLANVQCLSKDGGAGCVDVRGFGRPTGVTVSPDDRFVYVTDNDKTITSFRRDIATGTLAQIDPHGCIGDAATGPDGDPCEDLDAPFGNSKRLVITPDGHHAYAVNRTDGVLIMLSRNRDTGTLHRKVKTCISEDGSPTDPTKPIESRRCLSTAPYLKAPFDADISPDGLTLYVGNRGVFNTPAQPTDQFTGGVTIFRIDQGSGTLAPLGDPEGCITGDGSAATDNKCKNGRAIGRVYGVEVAPDGKTLYASSGDNDTIAVLPLNRETGAAGQLAGAPGCLSATGTTPAPENATCTKLRGFDAPLGIALSPDGASLYAASTVSRSLTVARRQVAPECFGFSTATPFNTPVAVRLSCVDANGDTLTRRTVRGPFGGALAIPASGDATYSPAPGAVGEDRVTYEATDGSTLSNWAEVVVDVLPRVVPPVPPPPPPFVPPGPGCTLLNKAKPRTANVRKNGLAIKVLCEQRSTATVTATVSRTGARALRLRARTAQQLATGEGPALPGRSTTVTLRFPKAVAQQLSRLSAKTLRTFRVTIGVQAKRTSSETAPEQKLVRNFAFRR